MHFFVDCDCETAHFSDSEPGLLLCHRAIQAVERLAEPTKSPYSTVPEDNFAPLSNEIGRFIAYYNSVWYYKIFGNVARDGVYFGRDGSILKKRVQSKKKTIEERKKCNSKIENSEPKSLPN